MKVCFPSPPFGGPHRHRGIALVITLSFLLVTTVIIVAFLVRARFDYQASASYSTSVQSELLAAGAMDTVVANFLQEIADPAKSDVTTVGDFRWFEPREAGSKFPSMVPDIVSRLPASPSGIRNTLIKQSIAQNFHTGSAASPIPASDINSAATQNRSTDRSVLPERWSAPKLLHNADGTSGIDFSSDAETPFWIYVKENGEATTTAPPQNARFKIAGRYAFNVYDVGGLLNVNIAGHPSSANANAVATKGSSVFADLAQIPGMSDGGDAIVNWRSSAYVAWNNLGDPTNPNPTSPLSLMDFLRVGGAVGWMRNPSIDTEAGGNQFFSRRELVRFAQDKEIEEALPFLTHFSVDLDAPTFSPDTEILRIGLRDRGGNGLRTAARGETVQESREGTPITDTDQKRINPPRFDESTFATSYKLPNNQSVTTPVPFKRFPLNRLALVQTDPSARENAGSNAALVRRYFGLEEDGNRYTWKYRDLEGNDEEIKTLEEVAEENREPNFFELLKSVIQVGSLAQTRHSTMVPLESLEPRGNRVDEHILRIGAAIIDQADEDSYPTRIHFNYDPATAFGEIYGVEDLPYIYFFRFVGYGKPLSQEEHWFLAQPSLWNPHNPNRRNPDSTYPSTFQISALKPNGLIIPYAHATSTPPPIETGEQFTEDTRITFQWNPDSPTFRQPQGLLSGLYPADAQLAGTPDTYFSLHAAENSVFGSLQPYAGSAQAIGFLIGHNTVRHTWSHVSYNGGAAQFLLKYRAGDSNYYAYDKLWFNPTHVKHGLHAEHETQTFSSLFSGRRNPLANSGPELRSEAGYFKSDPRSQRFIWPTELIYYSGPFATQRFRLPEGLTAAPWGGVRAWSSPVTGFDETDNRFVLPQGRGGFTDLWKLTRLSHPAGSSNDWTYREDLGYLSINSKDLSAARGFYYSDQDSVVRRAMAGAIPSSALQGFSNDPPGTLVSQQRNDSVPTPMQSVAIRSQAAADEGRNFYENRPVVLNRPFRSVGELAQAFRDVPWKNVDFSFQESGDAGLLDVFTIHENEGSPSRATPLVAGRVNLNTAPPPVLNALLYGAAKELPPGDSTSIEELTDVAPLTQRILQYRSATEATTEEDSGANGPLRSLAELVGRVYSSGAGKWSDNARFVGLAPEQFGTAKDRVRPERMATLVRSLADSGTTRTWNLMIDLVAQSGRGTDLANFTATSESRWWLFVSIDRFTGEVLSRSLEQVVE